MKLSIAVCIVSVVVILFLEPLAREHRSFFARRNPVNTHFSFVGRNPGKLARSAGHPKSLVGSSRLAKS